LERSGLLDTIRTELLEGHLDSKGVEAELYKLNVYGEFLSLSSVVKQRPDIFVYTYFICLGKGSFFKPHKDTPRGKNMFGSLVVVFPTPHEGGALILRHNGQEWTFDSGKILSQQPSPSIAYIAFYSNIEHEVTAITSGNRVTLTYNLYFKSSAQQSAAQIAPTPRSNEDRFKSALSLLLQDSEFLPDGGKLGFGLQHQYPVGAPNTVSGSMTELLNCLKGSDAIIRQVCQELSLQVSLNVMYYDEDSREVTMTAGVIDKRHDGGSEDGITEELRQYYNGKWVKPHGMFTKSAPDDGYSGTDEEVWWVTEMTELTRVKTPYIAYGNESTLDYIYGDICLIVSVGETKERATLALTRSINSLKRKKHPTKEKEMVPSQNRRGV
jgi:hypothetical protein